MTGRRRITAGLALSGKRCVFARELRWLSNGARFKLLLVLPRCLGPGLWGGVGLESLQPFVLCHRDVS